ncbi:protein E30 [Proboscivirus elephantidbeta4]|uniref:Protein E30 n=1 Tax=Elephant endotheliotropic herpesvirus 4 TaxID=548914 RepID=A0A0S1TP54_9BETA|nr:protein E30 [Elephant endotheliotropic herpesvirus 4]ALM25965.1 protein E30 [Elephant endotheliotropic herpesvirus 4]
MKRYKNWAHALNVHTASPAVTPETFRLSYKLLILVAVFATTMEISREEDVDFCFEEVEQCEVEYADPEDNEEVSDDDGESSDGDSVDHAEEEKRMEEECGYRDLPPREVQGPPVCLDLTVIEPEMQTANIKCHEVCDEYGKRGYSFQGLIYYDPQEDDEDDDGEYDDEDFDEDEEELTAM